MYVRHKIHIFYFIFKKNITGKNTFKSIYHINYYHKFNNLPKHNLVPSIRNSRNLRDGCTKISVCPSFTRPSQYF